MEELKSLAEAAGYEVVGMLEQTTRPRSRFYIGSGKVAELRDMVKMSGAEKVIFGNELKITQVYNLAKAVGVEVVDRLQLILEIFKRRASTEEANLQIELARLRHELAYAKEKVRLARLGEQPGFHGLGKYEVDVYHGSVKRQVYSIEKKLQSIKKTRRLHRDRRRKLDLRLVSLAGYTNSGKSTLFNALTKANVPVGSDLFTTLSTTTRAISIQGQKILITDTVGFIDKLPVALIEAFHSTLEETTLSDLILLVIDGSESFDEIDRKLSCCLDTIQEIGGIGIPLITVLNKIDLISDEVLCEKMKKLKSRLSTIVPISALYEINLNLLIEEMKKYLVDNLRSILALPITEKSFSILSWIFSNAEVQSVRYEKDLVHVLFESSHQIAESIRKDVENVGGIFRFERTADMDSQIKS
ncbi:MAG: GTPase HflX [Candidatus Jordarchaeaceae archaeon]